MLEFGKNLFWAPLKTWTKEAQIFIFKKKQK